MLEEGDIRDPPRTPVASGLHRTPHEFGSDTPIHALCPELEQTMLSMARELTRYMKARRKWWLVPVMAVLFMVGGLLVLTKGTAIAPFIYTIF